MARRRQTLPFPWTIRRRGATPVSVAFRQRAQGAAGPFDGPHFPFARVPSGPSARAQRPAGRIVAKTQRTDFAVQAIDDAPCRRNRVIASTSVGGLARDRSRVRDAAAPI